MNEEIMKLAESLQKEAHDYADAIIERNPDIEYQSAFNAWLFLKLAQLTLIK